MGHITPWQQYQRDLKQNNFQYDPAQQSVMQILQKLYDELCQANQKQTLLAKIGQYLGLNKTQPIKGVYLWGGVGRGKSYLMDVFYNSLPFDKKLRAHFHHFMQRIHQELDSLKGVQDPLIHLANKLSKEYQVICFDEFFVSDITDAMLLGTLFNYLFQQGVVLVATSNIAPDDLYKNGLQRARFLPAIALIKQHCQVVLVDSGQDYRLRTLEQAKLYHCPIEPQTQTHLLECFNQLAAESQISVKPLAIDGRNIDIEQQAQGVLMADFRQLCHGPRSQRDYMEIARLFHSVILTNLEQMGAEQTGDDIARRFLAMVDEFYDRQVKLIISSQITIDQLYAGGRLDFEFQRCRSRLIEMQSHEYLALEHLP